MTENLLVPKVESIKRCISVAYRFLSFIFYIHMSFMEYPVRKKYVSYVIYLSRHMQRAGQILLIIFMTMTITNSVPLEMRDIVEFRHTSALTLQLAGELICSSLPCRYADVSKLYAIIYGADMLPFRLIIEFICYISQACRSPNFSDQTLARLGSIISTRSVQDQTRIIYQGKSSIVYSLSIPPYFSFIVMLFAVHM